MFIVMRFELWPFGLAVMFHLEATPEIFSLIEFFTAFTVAHIPYKVSISFKTIIRVCRITLNFLFKLFVKSYMYTKTWIRLTNQQRFMFLQLVECKR